MRLIDLHCHILPYVDDGAADLDEAVALLRMEAEQGVTELCLTPHLRSGMFRSPDEKIWDEYQRLQDAAAEAGIAIPLWLSREYFYDSDFRERLEEGRIIQMGASKTLLVEFRYDTPVQELLAASALVQEAGFRPLFAHVERYGAVQKDAAVAVELANMGTMLQMNASSLLGWEGWRQRFVAKRLLTQGAIHVIASDSHDVENRKPNLRLCADYLTKKYGRDLAMRLIYGNPFSILNDTVEE